MITKDLKAVAIAKIKSLVPLEEIAISLEVPIPLLKEWQENMPLNDVIMVQANTFAIQKLANGEIIPPSVHQEELLRVKIEEVAIEIVDEVHLTVMTGDLVKAKTLQLCADTITKLYSALINKLDASGEQVKPNGREITAFKSLMKD